MLCVNLAHSSRCNTRTCCCLSLEFGHVTYIRIYAARSHYDKNRCTAVHAFSRVCVLSLNKYFFFFLRPFIFIRPCCSTRNSGRVLTLSNEHGNERNGPRVTTSVAGVILFVVLSTHTTLLIGYLFHSLPDNVQLLLRSYHPNMEGGINQTQKHDKTIPKK